MFQNLKKLFPETRHLNYASIQYFGMSPTLFEKSILLYCLP